MSSSPTQPDSGSVLAHINEKPNGRRPGLSKAKLAFRSSAPLHMLLNSQAPHESKMATATSGNKVQVQVQHEKQKEPLCSGFNLTVLITCSLLANHEAKGM